MTSYFSNFPDIIYRGRQIKDIGRIAGFLSKIKNNASVYSYYIVRSNERPEDIAEQEFGNVDLHWIVLYLNDIIDPYHDWPMSDSQLLQYTTEKYGADKVYATHHYELPDGEWTSDWQATGVLDISNLSYENRLNEEKRKIKLLKPFYLNQVIEEFKKAIK